MERRDHLSQVDIALQRDRRLKKRVLVGVAVVFVGLGAWVRAVLLGQLRLWQTDQVAALAGPDGSVVMPLHFVFWYAVLVFACTRNMAALPPVDRIVFEVMVLYNACMAAAAGYVAFEVAQEAWRLGFGLVGNRPTPSQHHLAMLLVLHYHLRVLEMLDTFLLILRKKIGPSLGLHALLRVFNVFCWFAVCRFGCGGDAYFPAIVNCTTSALLHAHYALNVLDSRRKALRTVSKTVLSKEVVTWLHLASFCACLAYSLAAGWAGAYPRPLALLLAALALVGLALYVNFQHGAPQEPSPRSAAVTFSFDSSGWLYLYHFGAAKWLLERYPDLRDEDGRPFRFSGASGGALVAACLATKADVDGVLQHVLHDVWSKARWKPWILPKLIQAALANFIPADATTQAQSRLRILVTRVSAKPPFFQAEVLEDFAEREHMVRALRCSSHIPAIFGWPLRWRGARYIDGGFWLSALVPWRASTGKVCRVSAFSPFGINVGPRVAAVPPLWWALFPPSQRVLEGLMWSGWRDMEAQFRDRGGWQGPCLRRGPAPVRPDPAISEFILAYESAAQRAWLCLLGCGVAVTAATWLAWVRSL